MRHTLSALSACAVLGLAAAGLDAIAARTAQPGIVWVLLAHPPQFAAVAGAGDLRVLGVRAGGHVLELYAPSLRAAPEVGLLRWRLPLPALALPACG